jgi:tRNA-binding protein
MSGATYEDFARLDIRAGRITRAEVFPEARRPAYRLWIDFGLLGIKQSSAQITSLYDAEKLAGQPVLAVVNLPPKSVAGFASEVLVLGVVRADGAVVLVAPEREVAPGERVL